MQFKIIIITGIFFLLTGSLSIANPISQNKIHPTKTEQTRKQKPNFFQKIMLKKIEKKIKTNKKKPSTLAKVAAWLGIGAFPLIGVYGIGFLVGLAALITGIMALKRDYKNKKSRDLGMIGIVLGVIILLIFIAFLPAIFEFISEVNYFN